MGYDYKDDYEDYVAPAQNPPLPQAECPGCQQQVSVLRGVFVFHKATKYMKCRHSHTTVTASSAQPGTS